MHLQLSTVQTSCWLSPASTSEMPAKCLDLAGEMEVKAFLVIACSQSHACLIVSDIPNCFSWAVVCRSDHGNNSSALLKAFRCY